MPHLLHIDSSIRGDASVSRKLSARAAAAWRAAHPGGTYTLPPVYVVNTGTQPESVAIRVERISRGSGRTCCGCGRKLSSIGVAPHQAP